jgi:hypothetical protein
MAITFGIAVLVVLFNVIADILYAVLDPRIRYRNHRPPGHRHDMTECIHAGADRHSDKSPARRTTTGLVRSRGPAMRDIASTPEPVAPLRGARPNRDHEFPTDRLPAGNLQVKKQRSLCDAWRQFRKHSSPRGLLSFFYAARDVSQLTLTRRRLTDRFSVSGSGSSGILHRPAGA